MEQHGIHKRKLRTSAVRLRSTHGPSLGIRCAIRGGLGNQTEAKTRQKPKVFRVITCLTNLYSETNMEKSSGVLVRVQVICRNSTYNNKVWDFFLLFLPFS